MENESKPVEKETNGKKDVRPFYLKKINQAIALGILGAALALHPATAAFSPWIIRLAEGYGAYGLGSRVTRSIESK